MDCFTVSARGWDLVQSVQRESVWAVVWVSQEVVRTEWAMTVNDVSRQSIACSPTLRIIMIPGHIHCVPDSELDLPTVFYQEVFLGKFENPNFSRTIINTLPLTHVAPLI
jgi:hypothetical protein